MSTGPVGWWLCNEGSGTIAHDLSGNANDATLENGAAFVTGQQGSAIAFAGSDEVAITAAQGPNINYDLTIAMWINRSAIARGGLLAKTNGSTWNYDLIVEYQPGALTFYSDNLTGNTQTSFYNIIAETNRWYHVAVVRDYNANSTIFFVDGAPAGGGVQNGVMNVSAGEVINIGSEGDPGSPGTDFFQGDIYDVRIYDRALSATEIATLAQAPGSTHRAMGIGIGLMLR